MKTDYSIRQGALSIRVLLDDLGSVLRLVWDGKSVDRNPSAFLQPFFEQWATEAEEGKMRFSMDFSRLQFMNSSSITPIIFLVQDLRRRKIPIVIRYDRTIKWQQLSFSALRVFQSPECRIELLDTGAEDLG